MGKKQKKLKHFDEVAGVLRGLAKAPAPDLYICPLSLVGACCCHGLEGAEPTLNAEHAPQRLLGTELEEYRCLTMAELNTHSGRFENDAAPRIQLRQTQTSRHFDSGTGGLWLPGCDRPGPVAELNIVPARLSLPMQLSVDEHYVELKTAYLVAFVALGYSYAVGKGLDEVRSYLADPSLDPLGQGCLRLESLGGPDTYRVLVLRAPMEAVLVVFPAAHCAGSAHGVLLPPANSDGGFFERVRAMDRFLLRKSFRVVEEYEWPGEWQAPMHWDRCASSAHPRIGGCFELEVGESDCFGEVEREALHFGWSHRPRQAAA